MNNLRNDFTSRLLIDSGIAKGMRVLDIGSDNLEERLQLELQKSDTPFIRDMAFGICAEKR